jgi:eukaryotic-like serine/threonine-protein kinase
VNPERWQQIKAALHHALELEGSARQTYLEQFERDDPQLHGELLSLVSASERAGEAFLHDRASNPGTDSDENPTSRLGRRIGPYRLDEIIGSGGMGEVFRATRIDAEFKMQVAIKLIQAGRDTKLVVNRFKGERQILAGLDHPNIARLLDGGSTADGMPYFVMELVKGQPIQEYCEQLRLNLSARLELFLQVCGAVQYAHQRLVVHRDLKPRNILVGADGIPKLLDFGIAKIFEPGRAGTAAQETLTVLRLMTPDYASPEQVRGEPVTTVSDVYSLGVILYELLTGQRPRTQLDQTTNFNLESELIRPSKVVGSKRQLRGDLDNIVMMALRHDPARRYHSVEQLAEDIQRHLSSRPVIARPDTFAYRVSRFVRRYTAAVAAAAAVLVAIVTGLVLVEQQSRVAQAARLRAEQRFNDVRQLAHALIFDIHDAVQNLPGGTPARRQIVRTALQYLDKLSGEASHDPLLQEEIAAGYARLGDIQGRALEASESDSAGAIRSYQRALALRAAILQDQPRNAPVRAAMVGDGMRLSELLWLGGKAKDALNYSGQAVTDSESLIERHPDNEDYRILLARSLMSNGYLHFKIEGESTVALASIGRSITLFKAAWTEHPEDQMLGRQLSLAYTRSGEILEADPQGLDEALAMDQEARRILQVLVTAAPHDSDLRHLLAFADFGVADVLIKMKKPDEAAHPEQMALTEIKALSAADPKIVEYHADVAFVTGALAGILNQQRNFSPAITLARAGLAEMKSISAGTNAYFSYVNVTLQEALGAAYAGLAANTRLSRPQRKRDWLAAQQSYSQALAILKVLGVQSHEAALEASTVAGHLDDCTRELKTLAAP